MNKLPSGDYNSMEAYLEHLQRKKKLRCSSRRRADSGRFTSMYEMVSSALSYRRNTGSALSQACCNSDMIAVAGLSHQA